MESQGALAWVLGVLLSGCPSLDTSSGTQLPGCEKAREEAP